MPRVTRSNKLAYSLLTEMTSLEGDIYKSFSSLYAWYQFGTDISSSGNLVDLSGNSRDLQPEDADDRPLAPTGDSPAGPRAPTTFPSKSSVFSDDILEDKSGTASNFSFGNAASDTDSPFSVSVWIKTTDATTTDQYVISKFDWSSNNDREWILFLDNGQPRFKLTNTGASWGSNYIEFRHSQTMKSNTWYHICATYDGSTLASGLKIYLNGYADSDINEKNGTYNGMTGVSSAKFAIGNADNEEPTGDVIGPYAEAAVWSSKLTHEEARALYSLHKGIAKRSSGYLNIPPRLIIGERDCATGSYPTVRRMGDFSRSGNYKIHFDDTKTIPYNNKIEDSFTLTNKKPGYTSYSTAINEDYWVSSGKLIIKEESYVASEGGETSKDGALCFSGPLTSSKDTSIDPGGRWIRTKNRLRSPTLRFDAIVGPYNLDPEGLNLYAPTIFETLKVQASIDLVLWKTVLELSPFTLFNYFADRDKVSIKEIGFEQNSRKRIQVVLGRQDFLTGSASTLSGSYIRIKQERIDNENGPVWALGGIEIDSYDQRNIAYPLLLPAHTKIAKDAERNIIATPHLTGGIVVQHGRTVSGLSDNHIAFTPGENFTPFNEDSDFFKPDNVFYRQGTPSEIMQGFTSPVRSKTIIDIPLACTEPTTFNFTKLTGVPDSSTGRAEFGFRIATGITGAVSFLSMTGSMYALHLGTYGSSGAGAIIGQNHSVLLGACPAGVRVKTDGIAVDTIGADIVTRLRGLIRSSDGLHPHGTLIPSYNTTTKIVTIKATLPGVTPALYQSPVYHIAHLAGTPASVLGGSAATTAGKNAEGADARFRSGSDEVLNYNITSSQMIEQSTNSPETRHQVMGYFNFRLNKWEKIAKGYGANVCATPLSRLQEGDPVAYNTGTTDFQSNLTASFLREAAVGFGPICAISTGSSANDLSDQKLYDDRILNTYVRPVEQFGFPLAAKFHATGSQTVKARDLGITSPFLLEKVVLDFNAKIQSSNLGIFPPGDDGPHTIIGTGSARFQHSFAFTPPIAAGSSSRSEYEALIAGESKTYLSPLNKVMRIKIPTFFIMRQFQNRRKVYTRVKIGVNDLGSQSTKSHTEFQGLEFKVPDTAKLSSASNAESYVSTDRDLITYGQLTVVYSGSQSDLVGIKAWPHIIDDITNSSLRRDALTVLPLNDNSGAAILSHTGSFRIEFPCRQTGRYPNMLRLKVWHPKSNVVNAPGGASARAINQFFINSAAGATAAYTLARIGHVMLGSENHAGRSFGKLEASRAYAGGHPVRRPSFDRISYIGQSNGSSPYTNLVGNSSLTGAIEFPEAETFDRISPYLILPDDDLVIGFQYPITSEPVFVQPKPTDVEFGMTLYGAGKIRLVGSLLQDKKEIHDGLNQNISSDAIHEMIGSEIIQDQHDLAERGELEGTFIDQLNTSQTKSPLSRIGSKNYSVNEFGDSGKSKLPSVAYYALVFGSNKSYFQPRIDWSGISGGTYHGDMISIPRSNNRSEDIVFEASYYSFGAYSPVGAGRIPMPGGLIYQVLANLIPASFFGTNFAPSYWTAFNFFLALLDPRAWYTHGCFAVTPPIPDFLQLINGTPVTTLIIGVAGADPSVEGERIKVFQSPVPLGLDYLAGITTNLDGDGTVTFLDSNEIYDAPDRTGNPLGLGVDGGVGGGPFLSLGPLTGSSGGGSGLYSSAATAPGYSGKYSLGRFFNLQDNKRAYIDSLFKQGHFRPGTSTGEGTIGTMQSDFNDSYGVLRPKFYFNHKKYGNFSDLIGGGRDSTAWPLGYTKNMGLSLGSPVKGIFVSGSNIDGTIIRQYSRLPLSADGTLLISSTASSQNRSPTSLLTSSHDDRPDHRGTGDNYFVTLVSGSA